MVSSMVMNPNLLGAGGNKFAMPGSSLAASGSGSNPFAMGSGGNSSAMPSFGLPGLGMPQAGGGNPAGGGMSSEIMGMMSMIMAMMAPLMQMITQLLSGITNGSISSQAPAGSGSGSSGSLGSALSSGGSSPGSGSSSASPGGSGTTSSGGSAAPGSATPTMEKLAKAGKAAAMSMGGFSSQSLCATGVSKALSSAMGLSVSGNGNEIDNNLPKDKFKQVDMSLEEALKIPGLVLTWEKTSSAAGSKYGHTAITQGDGKSSASDFIERDTLAASGGRTGLKIFMPV